MQEKDSDNSEDYELEVIWSAGNKKSKTKCVCNSEWRCRCSIKLTPIQK